MGKEKPDVEIDFAGISAEMVANGEAGSGRVADTSVENPLMAGTGDAAYQERVDADERDSAEAAKASREALREMGF